MKLLENLTPGELKAALESLRMYADMRKKLGQRGRELFSKNLSGEKKFMVEYFPVLWEDAAWQQAQTVFQKTFGLKVEKQKVHFIPKENIKWGMKVYVDDMMLDLSFTKVERLLQK